MKPEEILVLAQSFMECRILHAAAELNLFTILSRNPLSAGEVAGKIEADARATAFLLDAVAAIGLLEKQGDTYHCDNSLLVAGSPDTILPMVLHMSHLWERWSRLAGIVKGSNSPEIHRNCAHSSEPCTPSERPWQKRLLRPSIRDHPGHCLT